MLSIALSELIQIFRNRLVLVTSFVMPVAVSAFFIRQHESFSTLGSLGYIAAVVMFTVGAFGLYTTTVTTLASRRQNLFLKRLRSTAADDTGILSGLLLPATVIALVQVAVILTVLAVVTDEPADVLLLVVAVVSTVLMMLGLGLATAGLTNSPEHAQVTTLPVSLGTIAIASWVGISGTEELTLVKRLLPGGLGHRTGRQRLERRRCRDGLPASAGAHARLGRRRRRAGRTALPLGTAPMTP